jgi:glycosyltransferase involved in cell wall biosynthesis
MGKDWFAARKTISGCVNLNICLIGDYSANLDEGLKNIAHYTAKELSKEYTVMTLNIKRPLSADFLKGIFAFNPDVVHYFTGPTFSSFVFLKVLGMRWRNSKKVISALHPKSFASLSINRMFLKFSRYLKPDIILVQDSTSKSLFESINYTTHILYNGVDISKFSPVSPSEKTKLRIKYGIDVNKFVLLHVGHLSRVRNLQVFEGLQNEDQQVVIVGSTYLGEDENLYKSLMDKGCIVFKGYCENVNELYALSDCYVFPVETRNSIFMPLSVLEAMSCNLPVVSTKFEGLTSAFNEGEGLIFEDNVQLYSTIISNLKNKANNINTRKKVLKYSWENIAKELVICYS